MGSDQQESQEIEPEAGFCIKARVLGKADQKAFINVTSHTMVDAPLNAQDRPVPERHLDEKGLESLRVPQFCGFPRADEVARYIDVVFHPWVVKRAVSGPLADYYKQRLLQLTIPFVEAETEVKLDISSIKILKNRKYMSGGGVDRRTPWPISVETGDPKPKKSLDKNRVDDAYADLLGPAAAARMQVGKLNCPNARKGAVKKGFLNSAKMKTEGTGMYDADGSGEGVLPEGAGDPMGWMPKKLRGMCNVVDTSQQSADAQKQTMEDYAKTGGRKEPMAQKITQEEFNALPPEHKKMYEQQTPPADQAADVFAAAAEAMGKGSKDFDIGSAEMADAMASFSDMLGAGEFGDPNQISDLMAEAAQGSHFVRPQGAPARSGQPVDDDELDRILYETLMADSEDEEEEEEEQLPQPVFRVERDGEQVVLVVELTGVTSLADVELELDEEVIEVEVEGLYKLSTKLPWCVDDNTVKAGFDKSKQLLTIRADACE